MSLSTLRTPPRLPPADHAQPSPRRSPRNHQPGAASAGTPTCLPHADAETQVTLARTLEEVLADRSLYMERDQFFDLVQDAGVEMSEVDKLSYSTLLAKPKRKAKNISYDNRFHPLLYTLAAHLWDVMTTNRTDFPNMPKGGSNKSTYIHDIGKEIAQERKQVARADIHGIGDDGDKENCMDLIAASDKPIIFILKQGTLLARLHNRYGPLPENKRTTIGDKVRVMGVLFMSPSLRDYLPDMLGKTKGGNRANLDAASARKRAGFRGLWMDFIDMEKIVALPSEWTNANTQLTVDTHKGDGMFDQFGRFDPNNKDRIALAWTEKEVAAIFQAVMSEYNPAMHNWMKGTGGGSGAPEDFSIWEQRDPIRFIDYSNQAARMYLSVVYIWDKKYDFLLVTQKDTVPADAVIDDGVLFGSWHDEAEEDDNDHANTHGGSGGGGGVARGGRRSASARKDDNIVNVLRAMNSHRDEANLTSAELIATLKGMSPHAASGSGPNVTTDDGTTEVHQAMTRLKATSEFLESTKMKLKDLIKKRKSLLTVESTIRSSKKVKIVDEDIREMKVEVKVLRAAKAKHLSKMAELCNLSEEQSDVDESDVDDVDDVNDSESEISIEE